MIEKLKIKHMSLATTALLLCGCSSTYTAKPYDKNHSKAYNLAYGAGIDNGLNDTKVPQRQYKEYV